MCGDPLGSMSIEALWIWHIGCIFIIKDEEINKNKEHKKQEGYKMESFKLTDYQCICPSCGRLMDPFHDMDGTTAYGCTECGQVVENEDYFLNLPLPEPCSHAVGW